MDYKKVSDLVGSQFTVRSLSGVEYIKFEDGKPVKSETPQKGFKKVMKLVISMDKDYIVGFSAGQVSQMFEGAMEGLKADLTDKTFAVKSNGKTGMDIRYFFNLVKEDEQVTMEDLEGLF